MLRKNTEAESLALQQAIMSTVASEHRWPYATVNHVEQEVAACSYPHGMARKFRFISAGDRVVVGGAPPNLTIRAVGTVAAKLDGDTVNLYVVWS